MNGKFRIFLMLVTIALLWLMNVPAVTIAQNSGSGDCPPDLHVSWQNAAAQTHQDYVVALSTPGALPRAAELQELRRTLDDLPRAQCDDEAYRLLQNALNLTVDGIISEQIGDVSNAELFFAFAAAQHAEAGTLIASTVVATEQAITIESPVDGDTVPQLGQVRGTFVSSALDPENPEWIIVVTPQPLAYPQANNGCPGDQRELIPLSRFDYSWSMQIQFGGPQDAGATFSLVLIKVGPETNDFLNTKFDEWCLSMDFSGLTQAELFDRPDVEVIQVLNVTRE